MTKRTWLITGVSSGFGLEMAQRLLARGDSVVGTLRGTEVPETLRHAGERLWIEQLELSAASSIALVVDRAWARAGRIDVVVSNAGYGLFGAAEEADDAQVRHQIDTNLLGSIQLVRAALPHLRRQGGGRILQLSTVGGQAAFPGASLYHASKWGIEGFIDALAQEVAVFGIGCTLVEPGGARTAFRYGGSRLTARLPEYDASPAIHARRMIEAGTSVPVGDPAKMVAHMIASVDQEPAPRRLALGSDAWQTMHKGLSERLAALEAQKDLAFSTDC
jgi:NAD(P)-dependent dehydrogenase (short-subunit alcohol dehydrogenase family)